MSCCKNIWVFCLALDRVIEAVVIVRTVSTVFTVGGVVFLVIGNEVTQREAIVSGYEVN